MSQSLHQIAAFHDGATQEVAWVARDGQRGRTTMYGVSWELHRAGEILRQVGEAIDSAHNAESLITYVQRGLPTFADSPSRSTDHGLSL